MSHQLVVYDSVLATVWVLSNFRSIYRKKMRQRPSFIKTSRFLHKTRIISLMGKPQSQPKGK
jgi:hypothetical protein